jgi:hypothetical protein
LVGLGNQWFLQVNMPVFERIRRCVCLGKYIVLCIRYLQRNTKKGKKIVNSWLAHPSPPPPRPRCPPHCHRCCRLHQRHAAAAHPVLPPALPFPMRCRCRLSCASAKLPPLPPSCKLPAAAAAATTTLPHRHAATAYTATALPPPPTPHSCQAAASATKLAAAPVLPPPLMPPPLPPCNLCFHGHRCRCHRRHFHHRCHHCF